MNTVKAIAVVFAVVCALVTNASEKRWLGTDATGPTLASVDANWSPAGAPTSADDVVLDAGSNNNPMTWDLDNGVKSWTQSDYTGTVTFMTGKSVSYSGNTYTTYGVLQPDGSKSFAISGDLTLSSGIWTHEATPGMTSTSTGYNLYKQGTGVYRLQVSVGGNCTIGPGASLDVSEKGFKVVTGNYSGPGYGGIGLSGAVACHGGMGARSDAGGVDRTKCYGSVARPQTIGSARDSTGGGHVTPVNYSVSGGGIFIHARTISGSGSVSASSGTITNYGPGGGGRVAIWIDDGGFSDFSVDNVTANAGNGHALSTAGTVFLWAMNDAAFGARLIVRGHTSVNTTQSNYRYTCTPISEANTNDMPALTAIVISDGANLAVDKDVELDVGTILASQTGTTKPRFTMFGGSLSVASGFQVDGFTFRVYDDDASIEVAGQGSMGVASGSSLVVDRPFTIDGSLLVAGTVSHTKVGVSSTNIIDLTVSGDMNIASGGVVDVANLGWGLKLGPGAGTEANVGGVHAGTVPGSDKHAYGSPIHPIDHGSGGYNASGGGVAKLVVGGTLTLDGGIRAHSSDNTYSGGGSGGSVWITAGELSGAGNIVARGASYTGSGAQPSGGGSGGRVSVCQTIGNKLPSEWDVEISVAGGSSTGGSASAGGTIYWEKASDGAGHGILTTGSGNATIAPELPAGAEPNELSCATLSVGSGNALYLTDDMTVGDFSLPATSTIYLNGHKLTVRNPEKSKSLSVRGTVVAGVGGEIAWPQHGLIIYFR